MPALAPISVLDGQGTPATQTFSIESSGTNNQGIFTWRNRGSGIPARYESITYSNKRSRGSSLLVHHYRIIVPITDTPSGGLERQVAQCMMDAKFYVPDNAPVPKRADFAAFCRNLGNHGTFYNTVRDGESYY